MNLLMVEVASFGPSMEVGVVELDEEEGGGLGVKVVEGASVVIELITNDNLVVECASVVIELIANDNLVVDCVSVLSTVHVVEGGLGVKVVEGASVLIELITNDNLVVECASVVIELITNVNLVVDCVSVLPTVHVVEGGLVADLVAHGGENVIEPEWEVTRLGGAP